MLSWIPSAPPPHLLESERQCRVRRKWTVQVDGDKKLCECDFSNVGQDEVVCFFNLIFHAGLGWGCGRHGICPTFTARGGSLPATGESQLWGACPNGERGGGARRGGWGLCPPSVVPRRTLPQNPKPRVMNFIFLTHRWNCNGLNPYTGWFLWHMLFSGTRYRSVKCVYSNV